MASNYECVPSNILFDYSSNTTNIENDFIGLYINDNKSSVNDLLKEYYYEKSKLPSSNLDIQWNQVESIKEWSLDKASRKKSLFEIDEDKTDIDLDGCIMKPIEVWERTDTINWLLRAGCILGQAYALMSPKLALPGKELLHLTKEDFVKYDPHFGKKIYDLLNKRCDLKISHVDSSSAKEPRSKRPQLPKFIINLLLDPKYCPEWIRWEDYEKKSFRFVRNKGVADLWGRMNNKKNMSYDKLTRAIRYYYDDEDEDNGIFAPCPERLVYRFGRKAKGFETENPNFKFQVS